LVARKYYNICQYISNKKMNKLLVFFLLIIGTALSAQEKADYRKANVNYDDFKTLVKKVEKVRKKRLISLNQFIEYSQRRNVIILDSRSRAKYLKRHISGSVNLPFTDFTQKELERIIPDKNTPILIYCNNNFEGDDISFPSKGIAPFIVNYNPKNEKPKESNGISLALNIPTYINLYGYGYRNNYELDELVDVRDLRIKFEGSMLPKLVPQLK
jgi:hypothetical protein